MTDWTGAGLASALGDREQIKAMGDQARRLLADAKSRGWAVDEETGTHLRNAITQAEDRLSRISLNIERLRRKPKFGNDDYAQRAAAHFQAAMDSDDRSLIPVYQTVLENLKPVREALDIAMSKYDASNDSATQYLGKPKED
ncbi:hypothetical protein [Amycolatopsis thermophila]|uniref:Uncharacterized protein n=1 Tax=Amycolatopsis thermophila TaxID=206084 RepID=A0ABU0EWJ5_9PSEU|nr:hypothetical protein [Amycolatopsis thermophila]MDQ0379680.1 hypothetical protein [Amycolatopsis thermophila]